MVVIDHHIELAHVCPWHIIHRMTSVTMFNYTIKSAHTDALNCVVVEYTKQDIHRHQCPSPWSNSGHGSIIVVYHQMSIVNYYNCLQTLYYCLNIAMSNWSLSWSYFVLYEYIDVTNSCVMIHRWWLHLHLKIIYMYHCSIQMNDMLTMMMYNW
jgi:hypothetical protein